MVGEILALVCIMLNLKTGLAFSSQSPPDPPKRVSGENRLNFWRMQLSWAAEWPQHPQAADTKLQAQRRIAKRTKRMEKAKPGVASKEAKKTRKMEKAKHEVASKEAKRESAVAARAARLITRRANNERSMVSPINVRRSARLEQKRIMGQEFMRVSPLDEHEDVKQESTRQQGEHEVDTQSRSSQYIKVEQEE